MLKFSKIDFHLASNNPLCIDFLKQMNAVFNDVKFSIGNLGIQEAHIVTFSLFIITLILSILFLRVKGNNSDNDQKIKKASGRKRKSQARA